MVGQQYSVQPKSLAADFVIVGNATTASVGDALLIYQFGGAQGIISGAGAGSVSDYGNAGRYELARIARMRGDTLFFDRALRHTYDLAFTQVIGDTDSETRVVENLTASPFDGTVGGILFVTARQTLTLRGLLNASASGFPGGTGIQKPGDCNFLSPSNGYTYAEDDFRGTRRGGGILTVASGHELGRAPLANGGGGGNDHNAGGGGGGNVSRGGRGGENITNSVFRCAGPYPGLGGYALLPDSSRLFFGGGGGAGHANNTSAAGGGAGGGIVVLWAPDIRFDRGAGIDVNGAGGADVDGDGAGGGGAAGTILLLAEAVSGSPSLTLRGGRGGNTKNQSDRCFGPGGGGAGGRLLLGGAFSVPGTVEQSGGAAGQRSGSSICGSTDGAAQSGEAGATQRFILRQPVGGFTLAEATICAGTTLEVTDESSGVDSVNWVVQPGSDLINLTSTNSGVSIEFPAGTEGEYTLRQILYDGPDMQPGKEQTFKVVATARAKELVASLNGDSVTVRVINPEGYEEIIYDFGDGTTLASGGSEVGYRYAASGTYTVSATLVNGRCGNASLSAGEVAVPVATRAYILEKDPTGCAPLVIEPFDLSEGNYTSRRWSFPGGDPATSTEEKPRVVYAQPGDYTATLTLRGGTVGPDTVATLPVTVFDTPTAAFTFTTSGRTVTLSNASAGGQRSLWTFGDGEASQEDNPVHTYARDSTYEVTLITTGAYCTDTLTQAVTVGETTATGDLLAEGIRLFPNPTSGRVTLTGPATVIAVMDVRGRHLRFDPVGIDLSEEPPGVYVLHLRTAGRVLVARVIRE